MIKLAGTVCHAVVFFGRAVMAGGDVFWFFCCIIMTYFATSIQYTNDDGLPGTRVQNWDTGIVLILI